MRQNLLSRRAWLCGVGGASLAVPFLPSLNNNVAQAQGSSPLNFVFVGGVFGRSLSHWYPEQPATVERDGVLSARLAELDNADGILSPILGSDFNDIREKFTLIRGLDGMQVAADGHQPAFALTGSGRVNGQLGFGYSIDAVLEESSRFYPAPAAVPALRTSPSAEWEGISFSFSSRAGRAERLMTETSPLDTYTRLFHPTTMERRNLTNARQRPVANAVIDDLRTLASSKRISKDDRFKLEAHLSNLSDIERGLGVSTGLCASAQEPGIFEKAEDLQDTAMNLEVAALTCGLTRIVTHTLLHHASDLYPNDEEAHAAAHNGISSPEGSGRAAIEQWKLNRWSMSQVARYIKKLDAVATDEGTLLDQTLFYYGNVESRGFHSFYDMPVLVAGAPHKLVLGQYLDCRPRPLQPHFGLSTIDLGRPYNQLLVSLLKAAGLEESDYEKFGQRGFGVYDAYDPRYTDHYEPLIKDRNAVLPGLLQT